MKAQIITDSKTYLGHIKKINFKNLVKMLATPKSFMTSSGAQGRDYYPQKVDYVMDIELDDENKKIYGEEEITYTNNSPDDLSYLWIQLDQNIRKKDAPALEKNGEGVEPVLRVETFVNTFFKESFDGGFNIDWVKDSNGAPLKYTTNMTMMRVDLPQPIKSGDQFKFSIKWWYKINNHVENRARSDMSISPKMAIVPCNRSILPKACRL